MPLLHALSLFDLAVIALYIAGLIGLGVWQRTARTNAKQYFLAGDSASWPRIGFSLYASTLGATSLIGLTGTAYAHGISVFAYEWMAALVLPVFCVFVLPTYIRSRIFTVPEFLERRYGPFVRTYVSGLSIVLDIFLDGAGGLFAGALLFQLLAPDWPLWTICALLAALAGGFLLVGGLKAIILVEAVQGVVLVTVCACLAFFTFRAAGGVHQVFSHVDPERLKLIMPTNDPGMPWIGLVTGVPLIGFYYWCTNQTVVQRTLSARSLDHGRWGSLFGGALKLTNLFLVILPGAAAVLVYPHLSRPDQVFSHLVFDILPHGLIGLIIAACLMSILSSLGSVYNATATLITMDFIRRLKPDFSDRQLIVAARFITVAVMVISVAWAQQIGHFHDTLWQYLQAVMCYFVPPVAAVFLAGLFNRRVNRAGAAWGLIVGTVCGAAGFIAIEIGRWLPVHFQIAAVIVFLVSLLAAFAGSLSTPPEDPARITPLMFTRQIWRAESEDLRPVPAWRNYRYLALGLVALTAAVVAWFW